MTREQFDLNIGQAIDESIDAVEADIERFVEGLRQHFVNDKILCLSAIPDSILMWSYYSQNHAGMVLRFTDNTPNNPLTQARAVRYVDEMPSLFSDELLSDMLAGYENLDHRRIMDEIIWTKSNHWAHEQEWRVYTGAGRGPGPYEDAHFAARELDGVIFGARTAENDLTAAIELIRASYPHVQLYKARTRSDLYALRIDPM